MVVEVETGILKIDSRKVCGSRGVMAVGSFCKFY